MSRTGSAGIGGPMAHAPLNVHSGADLLKDENSEEAFTQPRLTVLSIEQRATRIQGIDSTQPAI
jgi:hypothetical protein